MKQILNTSLVLRVCILFSLSLSSCFAKENSISDMTALNILLNNQNMELSEGKYCTSSSAKENAILLSDYTASHWVMHTDSNKKNWVDIQTTPDQRGLTSIKIMFYSEYMEEEGKDKWLRKYGNGVSFVVNKEHEIINNTLMCIGTD